MEELLEKIVKNTAHKTSFQIIVSGNKSSFNTRLNSKLITIFLTSMRQTMCLFTPMITVIRG